ncbi:MAG: S9 family peptidase [Bacteroidota bacterium]|jgi:dipeptidyl-peptidase-4
MHYTLASRLLPLFFCLLFSLTAIAQELQWTSDGNSYWVSDKEGIAQVNFATKQKTVIVATDRLTPAGAAKPLSVRSFKPSADGKKILIFTNTQRVWRYETRGDYWVYDLGPGTLRQLGTGLPVASLMFAKISPDGLSAAYVSKHNIYVENLASGKITRLTSDGTDKIINGTFDWAYEEEFDCRDGFRWSPDSKSIAYWQIDASDVKYFLMINNTDSIYSRTIPVEYPKVGENPSACRIGVINLKSKKTTWMKVPGDPVQHYIPRMGWTPGTTGIVLQQLDRKQQESKTFICQAATGAATQVYAERDEAWTDVQDVWRNEGGLEWISQGNEFIWASEKNGWRSYYRVSRDGQREVNITPGDYDVISPVLLDEANNAFYFMASPDNATERYLYRTSLDGTGKAVRLTPMGQKGTHSYQISSNGLWAFHSFSNAGFSPARERISLPDHRSLDVEDSVAAKWAKHDPGKNKVEFFQVTTSEGVTMDGWMVKPANLDTTKKYPVVFYVYSEPAGATVRNAWGTGSNWLYDGDAAADGYCYISLDNRGTPAPKGRAWRKAIYRKIGIVNIRDQALGAQALLKRWSWLDEKRVAVHGWSGGGSATLNLLFQYPEIYQTGISVAAVANQLCYDNIYQERYMGLPQENRDDFVAGSPVTHAKNLKGNLLYIHGTGDDNVHFQNAELLVNELVKHGKQFQYMAYPNRSHGISEGEGTSDHLKGLFTRYLQEKCPAGARSRTMNADIEH